MLSVFQTSHLSVNDGQQTWTGWFEMGEAEELRNLTSAVIKPENRDGRRFYLHQENAKEWTSMGELQHTLLLYYSL